MKRLAAISALVVIATALGLATSGSASASVLCRVNQAPCPAEETYEKAMWEVVALQGTKNAIFALSTGNIICDVSAGGSIADVGGEGKLAEVELTGMSFTNCQYKGEKACGWTPTTNNLPYEADFEGSGGSGSMTVSDPAAVSVRVLCWGTDCTFSASSVKFEVTGGSQAEVTAKNVPMGFSGVSCPASAELTLEFKTGTPSFALFIVGGAAPNPVTRLCTVNVSPCAKVFRHSVGATLEAGLEGKSTFEFLYEGLLREPACEGGSLTAKTTEPGKPLIGQVSAMSFSSCGGGVCAVQAQSLPYTGEFEKTTGGNGTMALTSGGSGSPRIEVNCGAAFKCIYKATSVSFAVTGSSTAPKVAVSQTLEKDAASEAECGSTMTWKATYKLTKPTALFVTS